MNSLTIDGHRNISKWLLWLAEQLDKAMVENTRLRGTPSFDKDRLDAEAVFNCAMLRSNMDKILKRDLPEYYTPEMYLRKGEKINE